MGKANQEALPGMERRDDPEIEQAAERYREIRDERCALSQREADAKSALIQVMQNKKRSFYSYNGLTVQLSNQPNVKVKAKDEDDEPSGKFISRPRQIEEREELGPATAEPSEEEPGEEERARLHQEAVERWRQARQASNDSEEIKTGSDPMINAALTAALHSFEGAKERWGLLQENGATDAELQAAISQEFGDGGGSRAFGGENHKGGKKPEFEWLGQAEGFEHGKRKFKGKALLARVRQVLSIGAPGQSNDPDADHSAAYPDDDIEAMQEQFGVCHECGVENDHEESCSQRAPLESKDDFTAPRCDECKRTDGGHTKDCSLNPSRLTPADYKAYAEAHYKKNHESYARKMSLTGDMDDKICAWKHQQAAAFKAEAQEIEQELKDNYGIEEGKSIEPETEKKSKKRGKLSLVEEAIDR